MGRTGRLIHRAEPIEQTYETGRDTQMTVYDYGDSAHERETSKELRLQGRKGGGAILYIPPTCMKIAGLKAGHKVILDWGDFYLHGEDEEDEATRRLGELNQLTEEDRAKLDHPFPRLTIERVLPLPKKEKRPADSRLPANIVPLRPSPSSSPPRVVSPPVGRSRSTQPPGRPSQDPEIEQARIRAWQQGEEAWKAWMVERRLQKQGAIIVTRQEGAMPQTPLALLAESYADIHFLFSRQLWPQETEPLAINNIRLLVPPPRPGDAGGTGERGRA